MPRFFDFISVYLTFINGHSHKSLPEKHELLVKVLRVEKNVCIPVNSFFEFIRTCFFLQISGWGNFSANLPLSLKMSNISLELGLLLVM